MVLVVSVKFRDAIYKSDRSVFRLRDIGMLTGITNPDSLKSAVSYYASRDVLRQVRRGIYVKDHYTAEELACRIYSPSYISLETVLCRAGVVFQYSPAVTAISYLTRTITVDGHEIVYRKLKEAVLIDDRGIQREGNINIAIPERAFLDRLYLSGTYYFDNLRSLDRGRIEDLLQIYRCQALEKRVAKVLKNG